MKPSIKNLLLTGLTAFAVAGGAVQGYSQISRTVDSTQTWLGYMAWTPMPGDASGYGGSGASGWGTALLSAYFDAASTNSSYLTLTPNTNTYNATDHYWVNADGSGANQMDASFYVQNANWAGQTLTFSGVCLTNSLVSPFTSSVFIKDFTSGMSFLQMVSNPLTNGQPFSISFTPNPGDTVQYGFETVGPDVNPTNLDAYGKVVIKVQIPKLRITALANQALVAGQNATFTANPVGNGPFTYQWAQIDQTTVPPTTNTLSNGGRISGATTGQLTISNLTESDSGTYLVTVSNATEGVKAASDLTVIPFAQAQTNILLDPGFERGLVDNNGGVSGWDYFSGSEIQNTNDTYYFSSTKVSAYAGTNVLHIFDGGTYNGVFQNRPASPGEVFTAQATLFIPSLDHIRSNSVCYLEVQFRDAGGNVLEDYQSAQLTTNSPVDTWITLSPTNLFLGSAFTFVGTAPHIVAPTNTATVRYQITLHSTAGGSVYADATDLRLREPVTTATAGNGNVNLSFPTLFGPTYDVLYKTNLTDSTWQTLTSVVGDGSVKTVPEPAVNGSRFYIINTQ